MLRQFGVTSRRRRGGAGAYRAQCGGRMGAGLRRRCGVLGRRLGIHMARPLLASSGRRRREAVRRRQGQDAEPRSGRGRARSCARRRRGVRACRYRVRCDLARRAVEVLEARRDDWRGQGERRADLSASVATLAAAAQASAAISGAEEALGSGASPAGSLVVSAPRRSKANSPSNAADGRHSGARARTAPAGQSGSALVRGEIRSTAAASAVHRR